MKKERWVIKIGGSLLTKKGNGIIDIKQIENFARQIVSVRQKGVEVVVVTSGAIPSGMAVLGLKKRPDSITMQQACATIGQPRIMKAYDDAFKPFSYFTAQILVTFWDLDSRHVYKHARATVDELLRMPRCVPIFNENDALSFEEIQMLNSFGDNDRLSAHIAILTGATRLIILSDVDGLKTSPDGKGKLISKVTKVDETIRKYAGGTKSRTSIGGMTSKIESADLMIEHGITTVIANGREDDVLVKFARGVRLGTWFEVNR